MTDCFADLLITIPEIFLTMMSLILLVVGALFKDKSRKVISVLTIVAMLIASYLIINIVGFEKNFAYNNFFYSDFYIAIAKIIILVACIFIMILYMAEDYDIKTNLSAVEFPIILILSIVGMMIMISANDLLSLYMGLELQSLCFYILAAFDRDNARSSEAGMKYFVLGALASGILLYGISLIYGFSGTTNFSILESLFSAGVESTSLGFIIGMVFIIIGFCFKISAVPFHMWTPDVYEGSPTIVTLIFSTLPKVAAVVILSRLLMDPFSSWLNEWRQVIMLASFLSMFVGALGAIKQTSIKRLLAYSSIGHVGFILIGLSAATDEGLASIMLYLIIYVIMSIGSFACVLMMKKDGKPLEDLSSLKGLAITNKAKAFAIAVLMFSMAGIPPLAGFYAKFYILKEALQAGLYHLALAGVIASVISAYYYLKVVKYIYLDKPELEFDDTKKSTRLVASFSVAFNLLYFLYPQWLIELVFIASTS